MLLTGNAPTKIDGIITKVLDVYYDFCNKVTDRMDAYLETVKEFGKTVYYGRKFELHDNKSLEQLPHKSDKIPAVETDSNANDMSQYDLQTQMKQSTQFGDDDLFLNNGMEEEEEQDREDRSALKANMEEVEPSESILAAPSVFQRKASRNARPKPSRCSSLPMQEGGQ